MRSGAVILTTVRSKWRLSGDRVKYFGNLFSLVPRENLSLRVPIPD